MIQVNMYDPGQCAAQEMLWMINEIFGEREDEEERGEIRKEAETCKPRGRGRQQLCHKIMEYWKESF